MPASVVIIAPEAALPALREQLASGAELHAFTDLQTLDALEHIIRLRPRIIALDRDFSVSSRGSALVTRVKEDPALAGCEIRVIAMEPAPSPEPGARGPLAGDTSGLLDQRGTRRVPRVPVRDGVEVVVDGKAASLVDVSVLGAQVLSPTVLKPNQRVRVAFPDATRVIRCAGSIAWASFEMPRDRPSRYRAGIELHGADPDALTEFAERHRRIEE